MRKVIAALGILMLLALSIGYWLFRDEPPAWRRNVLNDGEKVAQRAHASGPLRRGADNSPYFMDGNGRAIYLTGSHVWNNLQEIEPPLWMDDNGKLLEPGTELASRFGFSNYLGLLAKENHNFIRLWVWEQAAWAPWTKEKIEFSPLPYLRSGPGIALDGKPRFDLARFDQAYFDRLRSRVQAAEDHGIYVSVMLFQGWSVEKKPNQPGNPWRGHPFYRENNINGIDGDLNGDDEGKEVQTLEVRAITALQESYVRKVVDTLNGLDNVLWEITNESDPGSKEWQYHMVRFIKRCEADQPKQHPVGMTTCFPTCENADLFASPVDWISPNCVPEDDYCKNPPASSGSKVIIVDSDHLCGPFCDRSWVWKCFTRGLNPIYMDPIWVPRWEPARQAMGMTLAYANRMNLSAIRPRGDLASTGYCLANPGKEYLVYLPFEDHKLESMRIVRRFKNRISNFRWRLKRTVRVDLSDISGEFLVEWCDPSSGNIAEGAPVQGGAKHSFTAPFRGDAVLYLRKQSQG